MPAPRVRVGVPPALTELPGHTSAGRIWKQALRGLTPLVDLVIVPPTRRRLRRRRVDVWLTDGHQGPIDVAEPVVCHLHEATWADPALRPLFEPHFLAHHERPSADAAASASRIITVSQCSKDQILVAYGVSAGTVTVAPLGVDHTVYRPGCAGAAQLVAAAGGDPGAPYVLFVSTVHPRKNLAALRAAMSGLARRGAAHALVLVAGPAADRADSSDLLAAATRPIDGVDAPVVNLAGATDSEVGALMAGAAAFCLPSLMEGFGMAVAEAMACGTPVVVSDRGSLAEVVGGAGIVVSPEAQSIEAGLWEVLSDAGRAEQLRLSGPARAAGYRWDTMARRWSETLHDAARPTASRSGR